MKGSSTRRCLRAAAPRPPDEAIAGGGLRRYVRWRAEINKVNSRRDNGSCNKRHSLTKLYGAATVLTPRPNSYKFLKIQLDFINFKCGYSSRHILTSHLDSFSPSLWSDSTVHTSPHSRLLPSWTTNATTNILSYQIMEDIDLL